MVPEQYGFLHSTEEAEKMGIGSIAAIHGSPWAYDTYVPIFFCGQWCAGPDHRAAGVPDRHRHDTCGLSWRQAPFRVGGQRVDRGFALNGLFCYKNELQFDANPHR